MSRSRKKYPITGLSTSNSEKISKILSHRKMRSVTKHLMRNGEFINLPFSLREVSDVWDFSKDGKVNWNFPPSLYNFDEDELKEIIKKSFRK